MYPEANYLIFAHFGIKEQDDTRTMIQKVSAVSYQEFCRRVVFQRGTAYDVREKLKKDVTALLCDRIPALLLTTKDAYYKTGPVSAKEVFDNIHHEICENIVKILEPTGGQFYGIAQRWLNLTLMNLAVVSSNLCETLPVLKTKKYFHVPVDQYLLEVATSKSGKFDYGLKLKSAPLRHGKKETYQMDWFRPGETQPCECWEYPEYLEFQAAIYHRMRDIKLSLPEHDYFYQDGIDWAFRAYAVGTRSGAELLAHSKNRATYSENLYLVYKHYGVRVNDSSDEIIRGAARVAYLDFCRSSAFQNSVPIEKRSVLEKEIENLLAVRIPLIMGSLSHAPNGQEIFDTAHHELCQAVIEVYADVGGQPYGIAQRWVNLTLINLEVIQFNLGRRFYPYAGTRWYFHIPVDSYLLEAATSQSVKFKHGLGLKAAPLRHDEADSYQMGWFSAEHTQPFERWGYQEYMQFQLAVRGKLDAWADAPYYDPIDWSFRAYIEDSPARNTY